MRIIDLLIKSANKEELPKKIIIDGKILFLENGKEFTYRFEGGLGTLNWDYYIEKKRLNDEIEIIEEPKKIKKCDVNINTILPNGANSENEAYMMACIQMLGNDLNALIDYINKGE